MAIDWSRERRSAFVALAVLAWLIGVAPHLVNWMLSGQPPDALAWNMTHYHISYQEFGFLRRGLVGSLMAPVLAPLADGGVAEYGVMLGLDFLLCLLLAVLAARLFLPDRDAAPGQRFFAGAILIAPVGMMQMGYDAARLDHVNFVLTALAVAAVLRGRAWVAALLMGTALLVHEAVLFYGVPVVVALALRRSVAEAAVIALPAGMTALALVAWGGTETDLASVLPPELSLAASVWTRGMLEPARGFPAQHYLIAGYMALLPMLLLYRHYRLNRAPLDPLLLAPAATLVLFGLGVDYGRWAHCLFFAVLLVLASAPALGRRRGADLAPLPVKLAILPWLVPLGPIGIAVLYPFIPWIV